MSLLLLFPSQQGQVWTIVGESSTDWVRSHYDFKNIWGEWESVTWGSLESSGVTWGQMAGFTFTNTTSSSTTWTRV